MGKLRTLWTNDSTKAKQQYHITSDALIIDSNGCIYNGNPNGSPIKIGAGDDSHLSWGSIGLANQISPVDMAMSNLHNPNRLAFANADGITIEYSRDGGATWFLPGENGTYELTAIEKLKIVSGISTVSIYLGGSNTGDSNYQTRITLNAKLMNVYTNPKKLLINFSTGYATDCKVKVEHASYALSTDEVRTWTTAGTYKVSGWTGWNSIPLGHLSTFGGYNDDYNVSVIRLTFSQTVSTENAGKVTAYLINISLFGENAWKTPSEMAKTGHIYTYDTNQNVSFPGSISTTSTMVAAGFYESSDETLKTFKSDIEIDLDKLSQIPKKYFIWKDDIDENLNIGTSAQEIKKLYPEIVSNNDRGLTVDYAKLSIIALAAIDKLHQEINELKQQINKNKEEN